jgi:hypothetical protein
MPTVKSYATERNWCNYCPDLIVEGEAQITDPALLDPFGDPGFAHADCADDNDWAVDENQTDPVNDVTDERETLRAFIRRNGPINLELP